MKILDKVREIYKDKDINIKEKAVSLFIINMFLVFGFFLLAVIRLSGGHFAIGMAELAISLIIGGMILLILKKQYVITSYFSIVLFFSAALGLFFMRKTTGANDIYIYCTYMIPVLITMPLLSYKRYQVTVVIIAANLMLLVSFFIKIKPFMAANNITGGLSETVVCFMMTVFSSFFSYQLFAVQERSLKEIKTHMDKADRSLKSLNSLLDSSGSAFDIGNDLMESSENYIAISNKIYEKSKHMSDDIQSLHLDANNTRTINDGIINSSADVKNSMSKQTDAINNTLSSATGILAEIRKLISIGNSKKAEIDVILNDIKNGINDIDHAVTSIDKIEKTSTAILSMTAVIDDITVKTNLLSMNASIEAAHAGDSGRGFRVVADEIRKLSDETGINSKRIRDSLKAINLEIKTAVSAGSSIQKFFNQNIASISSLKDAMSQLIDQIILVSDENQKVKESVELFNGINKNVNNSIIRMEDDLRNGIEKNNSIIGLVNKFYLSMNELNDSLHNLVNESEKLKVLGKKNQESFNHLKNFRSE